MARTADPSLAERRRHQIMEAALACFRRRGFHQTSMQEICAESGLSAGAVYRYFPSKNDIIAAIAEDDRRRSEAQLSALETCDDLVSCLVAFARGFVEEVSACQDAPLIGDVFAEAMRDETLACRLHKGAEHMRYKLADRIRLGQARGELDAALSAEQLARIVLGALDGMAMRVLMSPKADVEELAGDVREFLIRLLRPKDKACLSKSSTKLTARSGRRLSVAERADPKEIAS